MVIHFKLLIFLLKPHSGSKLIISNTAVARSLSLDLLDIARSYISNLNSSIQFNWISITKSQLSIQTNKCLKY